MTLVSGNGRSSSHVCMFVTPMPGLWLVRPSSGPTVRVANRSMCTCGPDSMILNSMTFKFDHANISTGGRVQLPFCKASHALIGAGGQVQAGAGGSSLPALAGWPALSPSGRQRDPGRDLHSCRLEAQPEH